MKQALTPEQIKEQKPYLDWSLSEREYDYISEKLLGRLPNFTETGLFSAMLVCRRHFGGEVCHRST